MKIYKTIIRVTVYSENPDLDDDDGLAGIADAIDSGDDIGEVRVVERSTITDPEQLRQELLNIGNDGEFFNHD